MVSVVDEKGGDKSVEESDGIDLDLRHFKITIWKQAGMIQFETPYVGITPSSRITGFFYSCDDTPVGYQGNSVAFEITETGWYWSDGTDNVEYVERICPGWFWFEMKF